MRKTAIKTVLVLVFAALAISTASANEYYLVPDNSNVPEGYCNTAEVGIWVNATESITSGFFNLTYTCCCANITQFTPNTSVFDVYPGVTCGYIIIGFDKWSGGIPVNVPAAHYHLGNITIHCCSEAPFCETDLNFTETILVWFDSAQMDFIELDVTTDNGTFTCGTQQTDLIVTAIDAYHNTTAFDPYHNLSNEVDVTVENVGSGAAGASHVSLYADGSLIGELPVSALGVGLSETVTFTGWTPVGCDCEDGCSPVAYDLLAVADCDGEVAESNEANNELTVEETAYWAGYSADEHLNAVIHGTIHGGLNYTTGDGDYTGLYGGGAAQVTHYNIEQSIPPGAEVELARLNVYYTWSRDYPSMEVNITNSTDTYTVPSAAEYNDRPCDGYYGVSYDYPYGNYVYDITDYVKGEGAITVTVKNVGTQMFCPAAPGIVILYEDSTKPEYEYWLVEGADLLEGGRRSGAGNLALIECISNATFTGSVDTGRVNNATLGIVSAWGGAAWGDDWTSYYWFNDNYLGNGSILGGYSSLYSRTVDGISMYVGESGDAEVGANVSDVTSCIVDQDNIVSFGDDGDSMMAANAFLLVEYSEQTGTCGDVNGDDKVNVGDVIRLANHVGFPTDPMYTPICN